MTRLVAETLEAAKDPDIVRQLAVVGVEAAGAGPQDFAAALQAETRRMAAAVAAAGLRAK